MLIFKLHLRVVDSTMGGSVEEKLKFVAQKMFAEKIQGRRTI